MEQSRLKLRISRMFRASFGSCRTRNIPVDVMEKAVFAPPPPRRKSFQFHYQTPLINMSPKARPFPSICKPTCPESTRPIINHTCIRLSTEALRRRRKVCVSDRYSALPSAAAGDSGRSIFPPASSSDFYTKNKKKHPKRKGYAQKNNVIKRDALPFSSSSGGWWLSSEDETNTLFSSRTLSSDSSEPRVVRDRSCSRRTIKKRPEARGCEVGVKVAAGRVRDSFAVVKRSSDPYNDFRTSMVEMIVEKQIFAAKDLEQLLQCFLSLNSHHHHKIILEVFTEIWEALFSNWS